MTHQLAIEGGQRALDHAQRVSNMTWEERAYRAILWFMERRPVFTVEQVKEAAYSRGLPRPPAEGAWGPIIKKIQREGRIENDGYVASKNPSQHGKPVVLWRVQ